MYTPRHLVLVDAFSLVFRAFHATDPARFMTSDGLPTNAIFGFIRMMLNLVRDRNPDQLIVVFDAGIPAIRLENIPEYKANREAAPDEFKVQIPWIKRALDALGIPMVSVEGFEADDVIGTYAALGEERGDQVDVITGDRDLFQLASDRVTICYTRKGLTDMPEMTPERVIEEYGVRPEQYPLLAAIRGDASDNIKGVPMVGPKVAAQYIQQFGDLEGIKANAHTIGGKRGESMRAHLDEIAKGLTVTTIIRDVPGTPPLEAVYAEPFNGPEVEAVFDRLAFRTLKRDAFAILGTGQQPAGSPGQPGADGIAMSGLKSGNAPAGMGQDLVIECAEFSDVPEIDEANTPGAANGPYAHARQAGAVHSVGAAIPAGPVTLTAVTLAQPGAIAAFLAGVDLAEPLAVAARLGGVLPDRFIDILALTTPTQGSIAIRVDDLTKEDLAALAVLAQAQTLITYDHKGLTHGLRALGVPIVPIPHADVLILAHNVDPDADVKTRTLGTITHQWLDTTLSGVDEAAKGRGTQLSLTEPAISDEDLRAVGEQAQVLIPLAAVLQARVVDQGLDAVIREIEYPLIPTLVAMEETGITVVPGVLEALGVQLDQEIVDAKASAYALAGREINLDSPKALSELLFEEFQLPKTKKTARGYSTNATALEKIQDAHPIIPAILDYRKVAKLRSTYVDPLPLTIRRDGRIHSEFDQTRTATGRLASRHPNLQNIPIRTDLGLEIRRAFVPGEGYDHILVADYSQLELRIIAHLSQDPGLIEAFNAGLDIHAATAAKVFGIPLAMVTNAQRSKIKGMVYGLAYGLSAWGLAAQLNIPQAEAKALQQAYFASFPRVQTFLNGGVMQARDQGWTETMCGRRRYFPGLDSPNRVARENAERMALNAPIQGSAADLMKLAMVKAYDLLAASSLNAQILLQVHDELVVEVTDTDLEPMRALLIEAMSTVLSLDVPLVVDTAHGPSWADAEKH